MATLSLYHLQFLKPFVACLVCARLIAYRTYVLMLRHNLCYAWSSKYIVRCNDTYVLTYASVQSVAVHYLLFLHTFTVCNYVGIYIVTSSFVVLCKSQRQRYYPFLNHEFSSVYQRTYRASCNKSAAGLFFIVSLWGRPVYWSRPA